VRRGEERRFAMIFGGLVDRVECGWNSGLVEDGRSGGGDLPSFSSCLCCFGSES